MENIAEQVYMSVQNEECPKVNNLTLPEQWQLKAMREYANQKIDQALIIIEKSDDTEMYIKDFEKIKLLKDEL